MKITEFLLARIAEDEEQAYALVEPQMEGYSHKPADSYEGRWSRRFLAECEAKRRIVNLSDEVENHYASNYDAQELAGTVLVELSRPYADHPDFDPVWGR
jgi:hypothetical protein